MLAKCQVQIENNQSLQEKLTSPSEENYDEAAKYIEMQFLAANENREKSVYTHLTCATDTQQVQFVLDSVLDTILSSRLKGYEAKQLNKRRAPVMDTKVSAKALFHIKKAAIFKTTKNKSDGIKKDDIQTYFMVCAFPMSAFTVDVVKTTEIRNTTLMVRFAGEFQALGLQSRFAASHRFQATMQMHT
uniref:PID domain-containing protein n=1 Tax=Angiostrongylus cantonensis TaxID=6313 RepID=A0A158PB44_ANGCA